MTGEGSTPPVPASVLGRLIVLQKGLAQRRAGAGFEHDFQADSRCSVRLGIDGRVGGLCLAQECLLSRKLLVAKKRANQPQVSSASRVAGKNAFLQSRYRQSQVWAEQSLRFYQALGDPIGIGDALYLLGWTMYELGEFNAAESLCWRAKAIHDEMDSDWGSHYALYGLGLVKLAQGDPPAAQQFFRQVHHFCEQMGYAWGAALAQINLGLVALALSETKEALAAFSASLKICEQIGNPYGMIAQSTKGLGYVALEEGDYPTAQAYAEQGLKLYREMHDQDGIADCSLILCQAAYESDQLAAAWQYLAQAEEMIGRSENRFREARTFYHRARIFLTQGDKPLAEQWLLKTIEHPACEWSVAQKAKTALELL